MNAQRITAIVAAIVGVTALSTGAASAAPPVSGGGATVSACPEVNDPPTYTITGNSVAYIPADPPLSSVVEPTSTFSYQTTQTFTVSGSVSVSTGAEAGLDIGPVAAKASVELGVTVGASGTIGRSSTVTFRNDQATAVRAVLGSEARSISYDKTRIVAPCNVQTTSGTVVVPVQGSVTLFSQGI